MFLKAGAVSLALLLASRLLGLARESAQAAAFGASGLADVAVLMLTLPDWLAGLLASGALAYVLLPAWAGQDAAQVRASQRRVARWLLGAGALLALALALLREPAVGWLAGGLPAVLRPQAAQGLAWSALALPAALLAALWSTRLQHQRDFTGLYGANLVVNGVLIAAIAAAGWALGGRAVHWLGLGLLAAMGLRLAWLWRRQDGSPSSAPGAPMAPLPAPPVWLWAALSAGLPLALPFAARSIASQGGEGALATFNYAWKLVELPLMLAIQLVATLAFPAVAAAFSGSRTPSDGGRTVRLALALAWVLACAAAAGLLLGAPALAQLLFGWGRLDAAALARIGDWGAIAAWGLLPQALIAVALTVLAAQARMKAAVAAYGLGLGAVLLAAAWGLRDGAGLMRLLNGVLAGVALAVLPAMGRDALRWMPWRAMAVASAVLLAVGLLAASGLPAAVAPGAAGGLACAVLAAALVLGASWAGSSELRQALRR